MNNFLQSNKATVSSSARGLMMANNLLEYNEPYLEPDLTKSVEVRKPRVKQVSPEVSYMYVYPNPAKDFITIEFNTGDDKTQGIIEIIDKTGRTVYNRNIDRQFDQIIIDTRNFISGSYIVRLVSGGQYFGNTGIIISH